MTDTSGMNIAQRILHVGGRNNAAGYVEFGSIQAVEALVRQVLRDLSPSDVPLLSDEAIYEMYSEPRSDAEMLEFGREVEAAVRKLFIAAPQPAPVQEPVNIEQIAAERYKVVPTHESMFYRWAVVAGDGSQQLYIGREIECQNMARKFAGAFLDGAYLATRQAQQPAPVQEPSHDVVAGAIFDFAGFLTSHKEMIEVGSCANASPMVERIKEWSGNRGLSLVNPDVFGWQMRAAQPSKAVKLSDDEISTIAIDNPPNVHIYARAIEQAVLKANGIEP